MTSFNDLTEVTLGTENRNGALINYSNFQMPSDRMYYFSHAAATNPYANSMVIRRTTAYQGGQPGWVNSALRIDSTANNGTDSFEWGFCSVMSNYGQGENVAIFGQGHRYATAKETWAATFEVIDHTGNDNYPIVAVEVDVAANGPNPNKNRIGIDIVSHRYDKTGAANETYAGVRVNADAPSDGYYRAAFSAGDANNPPIQAQAAYIANTNGWWGYYDKGKKNHGIYLDGQYTDSAICIPAGTKIALERYCQIYLWLNPLTRMIELKSGNRVLQAWQA